MTLHALQDAPSPELARALAEFEKQFTYPLGPGRTFRISHGEDYPRFFRAMGEAVCFVAEDKGRVLGALGVAVRRLLLPDGSELRVAYIGDLKVDPAARKGLTFLQMAWAAQAWIGARATAGYGVVMDGTAVSPASYTGRFGIPGARVLGKVVVWQFPCRETGRKTGAERFLANGPIVLECYRRLSQGRYASAGGTPAERSEMPPTWLLHPDGVACGLVEDTRRAKRLLADDGTELRSGHLSFFAYKAPQAAAELIQAAIRQAARWGHPALFVSVAEPDATELEAALGPIDKVIAPATVYGGLLDDGIAWNINSSEI
jgi:hypothetical protein